MNEAVNLYRPHWRRTARRHRWLILALVTLPTVAAGYYMERLLPDYLPAVLNAAMILMFMVLFAWIALGFWTGVIGFWCLLRRRGRWRITAAAGGAELDPGARCALLIPICNEDVDRVADGLRAMYRSLLATGEIERFDFFLLSDTSDPDTWIQEEVAWERLRGELGAERRLFYRHRRVNLKRKSGNVSDFCRRWGENYRYMIALDADSLMSGESVVRLVALMEATPAAALIQTVPLVINGETFFGRMQQFANRFYTPLFAAGLNFWLMGDANYWGHNAIIRLAPFMRHCALPKLSGTPPLGGEILSHDFVEAALLGRAGWELWIAYDLPGSYEESPQTLLDELKRDRRWCQGNLQHLRLIGGQGLSLLHRGLFVHGVMSYLAALLWAIFLALGTAIAVAEQIYKPDYFNSPGLFPTWPVTHFEAGMTLLVGTLALLFLPKFLAAVLVIVKGEVGAYGGAGKTFASVLLETLLSVILAPMRMWHHTHFVVLTLLGRQVTWAGQRRGGIEITWGDAFRNHWLQTATALAWGTLAYWLNPVFFAWLSPVLLGLVLAIPLSTLTSRLRLGEGLRGRGLFLTPEESAPPEIIAELRHLRTARGQKPRPAGFVDAIVDPRIHALHLGLLRKTCGSLRRSARRWEALRHKALLQGPDVLSPRERRILLADPASMRLLHTEVWMLSNPKMAARWGIVLTTDPLDRRGADLPRGDAAGAHH